MYRELSPTGHRFSMSALHRGASLAIPPWLILCAVTTAQTTGDWPQWRGADRANRSSDTGLLASWESRPPELLWTATGLGQGFASVSVVGGRVYTTGNFDGGQGVVAMDAEGGSILWKRRLTAEVPRHDYQGSRSTPTFDDGRLFVVTSDGALYSLSAETGEVFWSKDFQDEWDGRMMSGWGYSESPLVDGDLVLCTPGGPRATIVALRKRNGGEVWRSAVPRIGSRGSDGAGYSSIVVSHAAGVKQYVQLIGRGVVGVRARDGQFLWGYNRVANDVANIPTPLVFDDYVFAATGYGAGAALIQLDGDGRGGVRANEAYFLDGRTLQNHHGGMVKVGDYVYLGHGHNQGFPTCVHLPTGSIVWGGRVRGPGGGSAAVTYADGHIIFRYQDGLVALVQATPEGYQLQGTIRPPFVEEPSWAHPVVTGGRLYLREQDRLMCYNLRP